MVNFIPSQVIIIHFPDTQRIWKHRNNDLYIQYCLIRNSIIALIYHIYIYNIYIYIYIVIFYTAYLVCGLLFSCEMMAVNYLEGRALSHAICSLPRHNSTSTSPHHLPPSVSLSRLDLCRAQHALHIQMARFVCFNMHMTKYLSVLWSSVVSLHLRCTNKNKKQAQ